MNMFRDEFVFGGLFDVSHSVGLILQSFVSLVLIEFVFESNHQWPSHIRARI